MAATKYPDKRQADVARMSRLVDRISKMSPREFNEFWDRLNGKRRAKPCYAVKRVDLTED